MKLSIATVSLSGDLAEKLDAIAAAGFEGVEIFENDLLSFDGTPADVRKRVADLGLEIITFQPFRDFEGMPDAGPRAHFGPRRAQVRPDGRTRLRSPAGLLQCVAAKPRRHRSRRRRSPCARRTRRPPRHPGRFRGARLGTPYQRLPRRLGGGAPRRPPLRSGSCSTASTFSPARPTWRRSAPFRATASSWSSLPMRRCSTWIRCPGAGTSAISPARASCRCSTSWRPCRRPDSTACCRSKSSTTSSAPARRAASRWTASARCCSCSTSCASDRHRGAGDVPLPPRVEMPRHRVHRVRHRRKRRRRLSRRCCAGSASRARACTSRRR